MNTLGFENLLRLAGANPVGTALTLGGLGLGGVALANAVQGAEDRSRTEGKSGLLGKDVVNQLTPEQLQQLVEAGGRANAANMEAMMPAYTKLAQMNVRNAQNMAQTNAALVGQLNAQKYQKEMAMGGLNAATNLTTSMIQNQNPYGVQAFSPQVTASY
jgi:hypothetical protein